VLALRFLAVLRRIVSGSRFRASAVRAVTQLSALLSALVLVVLSPNQDSVPSGSGVVSFILYGRSHRSGDDRELLCGFGGCQLFRELSQGDQCDVTSCDARRTGPVVVVLSSNSCAPSQVSIDPVYLYAVTGSVGLSSADQPVLFNWVQAVMIELDTRYDASSREASLSVGSRRRHQADLIPSLT
jgi:hypothetical protein